MIFVVEKFSGNLTRPEHRKRAESQSVMIYIKRSEFFHEASENLQREEFRLVEIVQIQSFSLQEFCNRNTLKAIQQSVSRLKLAGFFLHECRVTKQPTPSVKLIEYP